MYTEMITLFCIAILSVVFVCPLWSQIPASVVQMEATATPATITEQETQTLYVFDLEKYLRTRPDNKTWQYDVLNFVSALQGLVNREKPQLYLLYVHERLSGHQINVDWFWLEKLRGELKFLEDYSLVYIESVEELIERFREYFTFAVLWDPDVPATSNLALTIAGTDSFVPIRHDPAPDSLFTQIVSQGPEIPHGQRLTDRFTGVGTIQGTDLQTTRYAKTDAYLWAKRLYLDEGLTAPNYLAFFLDAFDWDRRAPGTQYPDLENCMIVNHDFYVAKKAFFVDLDPWHDEVATDGSTNPFDQGTDERVLAEILKSQYNQTIEGERIIRVGGTVPWWVKYSNYGTIGGKHTPADTVEEFVSTMSAFNGLIDGGAYPFTALANASLYQHYPLQERYFQNPVPPQIPLENKNYLLFIIGDFHSSSLLYQAIPTLWNDLTRGEMPLAWAISPLMSERVPHVLDYLYRTKSENDYFVSGTAGAGLCYPNRFFAPREHSELADGIDFWQKISHELYQKFDLRITVAADLDRDTQRMALFEERFQEPFRTLSPQGVETLKPVGRSLVQGIVPFIQETGNFPQRLLDVKQVAQRIVENSKTGQPMFHVYRFNLANPSALYYLAQVLKSQHPDLGFTVLDPYSFFFLLRQYFSDGDRSVNYLIPTFLSSTIPREMNLGDPYTAQITLRNDGWDIWNPEGTTGGQRCRLVYNWIYEGDPVEIPGKIAAYIDQTVPPGERITLNTQIEAPTELQTRNRTGLFTLILRFEQEGGRRSAIEERIRLVLY
ncbi:MAG: GxGYxYP domain-containing protein [bacterium]